MITINLGSADSIISWLYDDQPVETASFDIAKLAALISKSLMQDGMTDVEPVLMILIRPLGDYEELAWREELLIDASTVFMHGSDWVIGIAEHLGFSGEKDGFVDTDWMGPHMKAVWNAMAMLSVRSMSHASDIYEQVNGHSMLEVLVSSLETGESFDQCQARLTMKRRGLQVVH